MIYLLDTSGVSGRRAELETKAHRLFALTPCEPIPPVAAGHYASLKSIQQRRGLSLEENDLWMAATAQAIGATLVTHDSDFQRIEGLDLVVR